MSLWKRLFGGSGKGPACGICRKRLPGPNDHSAGLSGRTCKACGAVYHIDCLGPIAENPCPKCGGRDWRWWPD